MKAAVLAAFPSFSIPLEGEVSSMYCDVLGLITTGVGCLIDPITMALTLPWKHTATGEIATQGEIATAWRALKSQSAKYSKLHWKYAAQLNDLRLDQDAIDALMLGRLYQNETVLRGYFPNWDLFPADAQLACCSMAWALGAGFPKTFGNFRAAANAQDWVAARAACGIRTEGNPGIVPRNAANALCCANAAASIDRGLDAETLFWPATVTDAHENDEALRREAEVALAKHAERDEDPSP